MVSINSENVGETIVTTSPNSKKQAKFYNNPSEKPMSQSIVTQIVEQVHDLPDPLQQQVLTFILNLRQQSPKKEPNAWDILESLTGTIEAPTDWSSEHDHYLYGTPKNPETEP